MQPPPPKKNSGMTTNRLIALVCLSVASRTTSVPLEAYPLCLANGSVCNWRNYNARHWVGVLRGGWLYAYLRWLATHLIWSHRKYTLLVYDIILTSDRLARSDVA